ncbi:uncharacterized protein SCHCODRAFT_02583388 [Schizophyllum commune H4-8]|uniref:Expressed protein n=1 Tax=Schizophyllum commune (strain H4-8 / FGSC 9210) TaxID=578458 RepID=D8Q9I6_SCHCM|nr:uncharacterized protein SCHCODRAFT_02583388 [Schizophyllum commune H4-8]KAI5890401.1 hypothetical protein SCHCODRAFT_02583388 [Schizophyllum commune H4-8]
MTSLTTVLTISPILLAALPGAYAKGGGGHGSSHSSGNTDTSSGTGSGGTDSSSGGISGSGSGSSTDSDGGSSGSNSGSNSNSNGRPYSGGNNHSSSSLCVMTSTIDVSASTTSYATYTTACSVSSNNQTHASKHKLSGGAIAGIVIGSIAGTAILAFILWLLCRRRWNTRRYGDRETSIAAPEGSKLMSPKAYEALGEGTSEKHMWTQKK